MTNPKKIFDDPLPYLNFLQSANFEGQYFDRKEICIDSKNQISMLREKIKHCISAFANSNRAGGLLVLGIADDGTIKGTQHVDEQKLNGILQVVQDLKNHATQPKIFDTPAGKQLHLLYTPWTPDAICETSHSIPKAWKRNGPQCLPLTDQDREQLKRDKKIVDFESRIITPYDPEELDEGLTEEFIKYYLESRDAQHTHSIENILYQAGAIVRQDDQLYFTNSGYLFFAANPRRLIPNAYIRLMRFDAPIADWENRGLPIQEKEFDGPTS